MKRKFMTLLLTAAVSATMLLGGAGSAFAADGSSAASAPGAKTAAASQTSADMSSSVASAAAKFAAAAEQNTLTSRTGHVMEMTEDDIYYNPASGTVIDLEDTGDVDNIDMKGIVLSSQPAKGYYVLYRFVPKHSGILAFSLTSGGYSQLLNSKKEALSSRDIISNNPNTTSTSTTLNHTSYGVTKGKTYYIKAQYTSATYSSETKYYIATGGAVSASCTGAYGKKASKASTLKKGKSRDGYIEPKGAAKYYKLSTKAKNVKIYINGDSNSDEGLKVTVTYKINKNKAKKYTMRMTRYKTSNGCKIYTVPARKARIRATIKVAPAKSGASGAYTLKWNNWSF